MFQGMNASIRDMLWFHAAFFALALPLAVLLRDAALGHALLALAIAYNLLLPAFGVMRGHNNWLRLWAFLLPLSCAQVLPDWALARYAQTLVFPDHGIPRIGGLVPVYFMGLWIMLLFPVLLWADAVRSRYLSAFVLALALFTLWEWLAPALHLWRPQGVRTISGVALYPLIPEALLAFTALWMYRQTRELNYVQQVFGAISVSAFYAGTLFFALLLMG